MTIVDQLPRIYSPLTDVDIPGRVWSSWEESGKPRQLRRALTEDERDWLQQRRDELAPAIAPFAGKVETDQVMLVLTDMFGSFRSMRQTGEEAMAVVDASCRALAEFPCWAIQLACRSIQAKGVYRDGRFDRQWPPNDAEIVLVVQEEIKFYAERHRSAVALLAGEIER